MHDSPDPDARLSQGRIRDVRTLKAFAHPLRMRIFEYLADHTAATSATLARELGESTGQTSYHLRQLAKYGFVVEIEDRGTARERWWKHGGMNLAPEDAQSLAQQSPLVQTIAQRNATERLEKLHDFHARLADEDPQWVDAAWMSTTSTQLTPAEMKDLRTELWDTINRHTTQASERAENEPQIHRRWVRIHLDLFPLRADDDVDQ